MKSLLYKSMKEKIPVEIIYLSKRKAFTHRRILVKEIKGSHLLAYCLTRKQMRIFQTLQIMSISPINRPDYQQIS
ncbi:putative DNA-binding transcriptional regulator YafY [Cytobacillus horneckiae]|uniref:WYL domain-containing protein n=1 Tax=Cytobacillus horneckiae TaxID=549687 RepID=A0A2N0ZF96_9BACI|nr:hypothetical protein [Cytobacillus horneckiae]NRG48409.1 hypothetical protein [Bacillus sp. CRN 9]MBN6887500.1 hypothetical protein [Cytobacillus horneckiae]MCM3178559.1 WYL domain-containing protein [Cytobacillus horneckiae]MEC1155621.1 hypothetical protein [Cytobacillus horneckiae]MED2936940.1 hypothetical protein [Cytobacillus horneckiae]